VSIIPIRDSVDVVLENNMGERFRDRFRVWSEGDTVTNELIDFLEPLLCKKKIHEFLTKMISTDQLKEFEGQQVRATIEYTDGYKVYSNPTGNYYHIVDNKGKPLVKEKFDSFKSAKMYAVDKSMKPAGMRVTQWMSAPKTT
jgi:hypothetical protein